MCPVADDFSTPKGRVVILRTEDILGVVDGSTLLLPISSHISKSITCCICCYYYVATCDIEHSGDNQPEYSILKIIYI